jgi:hypothetical protein
VDRYEELSDRMILLERKQNRATKRIKKARSWVEKMAIAYQESDKKHTRREIEIVGLLKNNLDLLEKVLRVTRQNVEAKLADKYSEGYENSSGDDGDSNGGDEDKDDDEEEEST